MNVVVAVAGAKHTLQVSGETSVAEVKAQLESRCGIPVAQQRLLVKGKQAFDDELRLEALGIAEGAKLMLLRNAAGAKAALASASSAASVPLPPSARSAPPATTPSAPTAPPIGHGPISLTVSQGRTAHALYCHADTTVREIKSLLEQPANAAPAQQRLLHKGKEATDELTIQQLGLSNGGKLMLLFRQRHHQQEEGRAMIASVDEPLAAFHVKWAALQRKAAKRLLDEAAILTEGGALETELEALAQDLRNSAVKEESMAAARRESQLGELRELLEEVRMGKMQAAKAARTRTN